ncbi:6-phospho-3-hexuloisomerase [Christensenella intestinihominis]|uniref:6-phospho-3-hexuloisomerase n=1 Tax=Christensenella intestinihominis TaxID=1851429 RepID=UPI00082C28F6|nr:6-phospho-3-hexuloisomerase [Christensenella intestinihominis]
MQYTSVQKQIVDECSFALSKIDESDTEKLVDAIVTAKKVFFVGVGRVLLSLQAICKRFNHIGIESYFVGEINEPAITPDDLLIVASGSGESAIPVVISEKANKMGVRIGLIGSNPDSTLSHLADMFIRIPVQTKLALPDELHSVQPMTSLFEQCVLLYGDALAKMIIDRKKLDMKLLWKHHANLE